MALGVDLSILNQKGTPAFYSDIFANRPAFGFAGRVFISTDTGAIYEDTGTAWTLIADAGAGTTGTLQQVTTNGNTTTQGISITAGGLSANTVSVIGGTSSQFLKANGTLDSATYALDSTVVHLAGTETITGLKTITGGLICTPAPQLNGGVYLKEGVFSSASGFTGLMGNTDGIRVMLGNGVGYHYLHFPTATANDYTYPATSGTLGLSTAALTAGSVVFAGSSGVLSQDNTNFFWDDTNKFLGIGNTGTPTAPLDIHNGTVGQLIQLNATSTNNSNIGFLNGSVGKWRIGNVYNAGANDFNVYNIGLAANALSFLSSTSAATFASSVTATQFVLSGATAGSGLYYNAANNRVTVANYTASGKVTIEVNGGLDAATFNADQTTTFAKSINVNSTGSTQIFLKTSGGGSNRDWQIQTNESAAGDLSFMQSTTAGGSTYATKVNIGATGNVLIGTTTDVGKKLTVAGEVSSYNTANIYASLRYNTVAGFLELSSTTSNNSVGGASYIQLGDTTAARFWALQQDAAFDLRLFNYNTGSWGAVGSFNSITGVYTPLSDINKKKDFENSTIGLDAILGLKPTLYRMKSEDNTEKHLGFLAQEVKEFIPQAYSETGDLIGINEMPIIAALVKSIQQLNEKLVRNNIN